MPHQFRDETPYQLRSSYGIRMPPLFPRQHNSPKRKGGNERVTGRKARGPQVAEGNKLQVADVFFLFVFFFFPSLLPKLVLPKTNFFFLFSNLGLIMAQQTSIHVNCFMVGDDTPCAIPSKNCILWKKGLVKFPQP